MTLYVGNLAWGVSSAELKTVFEQAGTVVSANVITDRNSGRSRGYAFVEMGSEDEARKAIADLDGKENIESVHLMEAIQYRSLDSAYLA